MRRLLCALAIASACLGFPVTAAAADVSSTTLVEDPATWDGRVVTLTGEAVGEAMVRGDEAWLHVNDDAYADGSIAAGAEPQGYNSGMAVVADVDQAGAVTVFGDYSHQGDVVEVRGVFNAACPEHGGDMDIHATEVRVVVAGTRLAHMPATADFVMLVVAAASAAAAIAGYASRRSLD